MPPARPCSPPWRAAQLAAAPAPTPCPGTPVITCHRDERRVRQLHDHISQLSFTRSDNTVVTPLFTPETVDLARLADFTELVEAPAVPVGTYRLGHPGARLQRGQHLVRGERSPGSLGRVRPGGTVLRARSSSPSPSIRRSRSSSPTRSRRASTQFRSRRLQQRHEPGEPWNCRGTPFATVSPVTVDYHPLRVRGIYVVNQSGNFIINLRPFYDLRSALGGLQVNVNDQTYYNVNQQTFTGGPGTRGGRHAGDQSAGRGLRHARQPRHHHARSSTPPRSTPARARRASRRITWSGPLPRAAAAH